MLDRPSWDLLADLQLLFEFPFMRNAFVAATLVALLAGAIGYFVVLRGQSFAAHTVSQVGFPGAAAGVLAHTSPVFGLVAFCAAAALGIGLGGQAVLAGGRRESAAVGTILAFSLALGLLLVRLYPGSTAQGIYGFLFGSVLGVSDRDVQVTAVTALAGLAALAFAGRPLFFASVDPDAAEARGVPVRALAVAFLLLVALTVAVTVQVVGTLLTFALLVTPGAAVQRLCARPWRGLCLTIALSLLLTWAGLVTAYFAPVPVGFAVTTLAFAAYIAARAAAAMVRPRSRSGGAAAP